VDEVVVQLLQIVALKESNDSEENQNANRGAGGERIILKHCQELLFEKKFKGVYARDQTDQPKSVKISLS
jgi:hypothetical protein